MYVYHWRTYDKAVDVWRGLPGVEPGQHGNRCQPKGWLCVECCRDTSSACALGAHGEGQPRPGVYEDEVYLVTALVPSDTACLASSPGSARRTAVWISREVRVPFLL